MTTDILAPARKTATPDIAAEHGLSADEYAVILDRLGRAPNLVELGVFSVMWSEHCSYKSSRRHLKKLPTTGPQVIQGPGENAGVVDIGDGQAVVFKMESHNHPSFIEPYNGAATGVGGILRDVFTMGARPVALMNALRFGSPDHPKTRQLVAGVVAGIGGYGNCVGVPTVGGETNFDAGYNGNILVNAMAVGIADQDKIFYARGAEPGQPIVYVGSKTGRDGIHGATMASAEFSEDAEEKRPTVQVGDPFAEKLLIEACLELMATDAIAAIQDMGAAGLTSSSVEMADKGGVGIDLNLDDVPQREEAMTAYEMMLSESQERMLMILKPGREAEAEAIFKKWELDFAVIGMTTDTGRMVLRHQGETVCDIPIAPLADDAPNYDRPYTTLPKPAVLRAEDVPEPEDYGEALLKLMASPDIASKRWIWEQYDRHVMGDTVDSSESGGNAAIVRVHGANKALAITCDVTPRYCEADTYEGGKQAVAEAYRNLCAVGAEPLAITDCLNFGNPERPDIMGQFVACIEGMAEACRALDLPVASGNVSLYNETHGRAIPPTPAIGAVGLIRDVSKRVGIGGAQREDALVLIGGTGNDSVETALLDAPLDPSDPDVSAAILTAERRNGLGQSHYARTLNDRADGAPPPVDLAEERRCGEIVRRLIAAGLVSAVHDISDGGFATALAEMALASDMEVAVDVDAYLAEYSQTSSRDHLGVALFGESQGRYLAAIPYENLEPAQKYYESEVDPVFHIGQFVNVHGTPQPSVQIAEWETCPVYLGGAPVKPVLSVPLADLRAAHEGWLPRYMKGE